MRRPVALVTGASRGIGKAIALKLAKEGYDLALTCMTNVDQLQEVAKKVIANGASCIALKVDSGSWVEVAHLFEHHIQPTFQHLDLVVNNAGIAYVGLLTDMSPDEWQQLMNTNLDSLFNTSKFAVPMMVQEKSGCIINISSIWGNEGASCEVAYSASKGGVNSFTKALAKELAPSGIRVNAIACGAIDTDMNQWLTEDDREALIADIGLGRMGTAQEVALITVFLASKKASYITGQIMTVDGGM